jgi:hypothetical protein
VLVACGLPAALNLELQWQAHRELSCGTAVHKQKGIHIAAVMLPCIILRSQATFERGLTFNEFLRVVMGEPPKQVRLKDVALTVSSILGAGGAGGLLAKMKAKQQVQATPAAASSAIEEQVSIV